MLPNALPASRVPDPRTAPPLRWGILGTGWIAKRFVAAMTAHTGQIPHAVGSRSQAGADRFAAAHGIATAHGSYDALLDDPAVDVVYIATPHNHHLPAALDTIAAGKHLLVEKPLGVNADEAIQIADAARTAGVYCAEALWTLFLPKFDVLRHLLDDGAIGEPRSVIADFGEWFDADHRIRRSELAGGPMLDLGTYPVSLSTWVLGEPAQVTALSTPAPTGVEAQFGAVLGSDRGALTTIFSSIDALTPTAATIAGSDGEIVIGGPFYQPGPFTVRDHEGAALCWQEPLIAHAGLHFEAAAVARDIAQGRTESTIRPLQDSVVTLRTMDRIAAAGARTLDQAATN